MDVIIRKYRRDDLKEMTEIWNEVVNTGDAFPQDQPMDDQEADEFFSVQTFCGVAEAEGRLFGLYVLHPNNIGRCGHIANASYAVCSSARGMKIGEKLVRHSMAQAKILGFEILQFNAVVKTNIRALRLYETLGFVRLGTIPKGFRMKDNTYEDIVLYYHAL